MKYLTAIGCVLACLVTTGGAVAVAQTPKKPVDVPESPAVHGFSVALVLGDQQGASTPDNLPPGAKKALADMRDFLPFKSYRLLDSQWILCCGGVKAPQTTVSGRLRGIDEQQYAFLVHVMGVWGSKLSLRFSLRDETFVKKSLNTKLTDDAAFAESLAAKQHELVAKENEKAMLEGALAEERRKSNPKQALVQDLEAKVERLQREIDEKSRTMGGAGKGAIIDSTFSMDVGETVVIGTSSLKGDKALIALLTAARRPGSGSSTLGEKQ
jgi:hypothetical protein